MVQGSPGRARREHAVSDSAPDSRAGGVGPAEGPPPEEPLALWEGVGVEIELMIVDADTLDVRPAADRLIEAAAGEPGASDVERGPVAWSNELALHIVEFKTNGPASDLDGLDLAFGEAVREASGLLGGMGCRLMPGGMHPWMDPRRELRLWPHEYTEVYRTFDRIFSCRGHGWANLQSTHINLPFRGDEEFALLHEAIRLVLPLIPALGASSPFLDGSAGPALDNRLLAYRDNAHRVPSVTGGVVPESVSSRAAYRARILEPIGADLAPLDPDGVLHPEWVNARGAIARFGRGAIEIRLIDQQECPWADLSVVAAVVAAVRRLVEGPLGEASFPEIDQRELVDLLTRTTVQGGEAVVTGAAYLEAIGLSGRSGVPAREVWRHWVEASGLLGPDSRWREPLAAILSRGSLAERLRSAAGLDPVPDGGTMIPQDRERLREVYRRLCDCLERGTIFTSEA